jgi:hypothetical protein
VACSAANAANRAPTIAGKPATSVKINATYSFKPAAKDPDGNKLRFSIANKPAWAAFNTSNGTFTGRPSAKQAGIYRRITISVTDGKIKRSLAAFDIKVIANTAPKISGKPAATVAVGKSFSFRPTVSDADGDTLAYSIKNKPKWLTFSTVTGQVSGKPVAADIGTYKSVSISVNDGRATATLPTFNIEVSRSQQAAGKVTTVNAVTLEWQPPTENTDGSALTNLAGYRVQYGKSASALNQTIQIANPSVSRYVIDSLPVGTHYFALKAYTKNGIESALSPIVSKKIL